MRKLSPPGVVQEYEDPWNSLYIDLDALKDNYNWLKSKISKGAVFFPVLKANAYGHGIKETAIVLSDLGCRNFAVDSPQEGIILRNSGIKEEILLMNPIPLWMAEQAVRYDLSVSVIHPSILEPLEQAASDLNKKCWIHLNINLGLNRMGIPTRNVPKLAREVNSYPHLILKGIFGQPREPGMAMEAMNKLINTAEVLKKMGISINNVHFANSVTFLKHAEARSLGVRLGILLYGVMPPEEAGQSHEDVPLRPVMSLKTKVVQIQRVSSGSKVGYHAKEIVSRDSIIGVIPLGYYHGLDRKMTKNGYVLIRGEKAPFIGAISMNAAMIDVTDIPDIGIGDDAVLFGSDKDQMITLNELASRTGTIAAELMMRFGNSIERKYIYKGEDVSTRVTFQEKNEQIEIRYCQTLKDLPSNFTFSDIALFLKKHLAPFDDPLERINSALDYALASSAPGRGFMLLALSREGIFGVLVCVKTDTLDFIPENIIVYTCVHREHRKKGIGSKLVNQAFKCMEGKVKLHLDKDNPAKNFYNKFGFRLNYIEMRRE